MDLSLKHHLVNFDLPEKLIGLINSHCTVKKYHQKDYFFHEGHSNNYTTLLIKGSLELYLEHIDKKILLYPLTSKQICLISLTNLFGGYPVNFSSIALEDCILLSIPLNKSYRLVFRISYIKRAYHKIASTSLQLYLESNPIIDRRTFRKSFVKLS